jgi:dTDP-4-amino-4,6-dideoxygalactose transaminase
MRQVLESSKLSGNGPFTLKCHQFFEKELNFQKALLTPSCTAALEMAAILINLQPGDEVIVPSYTFPSSANAFLLRGAKIVFADSHPYHPNIDESLIESLITSRTRAIVPVHYAGMACNMDEIMRIAQKHNLFVIEDAAQAITTSYKGKPLGSFGDMSAFSFHETKNIGAGEAGMLVINNASFNLRAEIIREKGTNRSAFYRGEVAKYNWQDVGSSFLPAELVAACLLAQFENMSNIQEKRIAIWNYYYKNLLPLQTSGHLLLPSVPEDSTNNAHIFYLVCPSYEDRTKLINHLRQNQIEAVFHYQALHCSPFYISQHDGRPMPQANRYADCLVRLPLHTSLTESEQNFIIQTILDFYH